MVKFVVDTCVLSSFNTVLILLFFVLSQIEQTINSVYYCASCSIAVKLCNRDEHELSAQHIKSLKNDELLKQLSNMYIESYNEKIPNTATSVENNIHDNQYSNCKTDLNATAIDISHLKINTHSGAKILKSNFNQAKNKHSDRQIDSDENKYGSMEKNYNKETESKVHMFKHARNKKNVADKSVEKIKVKNSEGQTNDVENVAVSKGVNSKADDVLTKTHFCDICNIDIPYHSRKCIGTHKSSNEHKEALDKYVEFLTTYQLVPVGVQKSISREQKHTSGSNRSKRWFCLVCCIKVTTPKSHVRESCHILLYDKLLSTNQLIKLRYELFLCKICNRFVKKGEELQHVKVDAKHLVTKQFPTLAGFVKYSTENGNDHPSLNLETLCDYSSSHASVESLNSPQHSKNEVLNQINTKNAFSDLRTRLLSENDIPGIDKPPFYFCTICKVNIANNDFNIKQHMTGNTHIQKAELLETYASNNLHHGTSSYKQTTNHEQNTRILFEEEVLPNSKSHTQNVIEIIEKSAVQTPIGTIEYICEICNVKVPNNAYNINVHNNGKPHKINLYKQRVD